MLQAAFSPHAVAFSPNARPSSVWWVFSPEASAAMAVHFVQPHVWSPFPPGASSAAMAVHFVQPHVWSLFPPGASSAAMWLMQLALAFHFVLLSHHHATSSFHSRRPSYFFRSSFLEKFCLVPSGFHSTAWCWSCGPLWHHWGAPPIRRPLVLWTLPCPGPFPYFPWLNRISRNKFRTWWDWN